MNGKQQVSDDERIINKQMNSSICPQEVKDDFGLAKNDSESLTEHNKQYTNILKAYCDNYVESSSEKRDARRKMCNWFIFILVSVTVLAIVAVVWVLILETNGHNGLLVPMGSLLTALMSLIGAYLVIPQIIVNYLFNKEEENNLKDIISKIQDYDLKIRDKK